MLNLRERRAAVAAWDEAADLARPGEVWTYSYRTENAATGGPFAAWTAGPLILLGDDCPVEDYRGRLSLGEMDVSPWSRVRWFGLLALLAIHHPPTCYRLERGDVAPVVKPGTGQDLATVAADTLVRVEHRSDHPVYAGQRNVSVGYVSDISRWRRARGEDAIARHVGDEYVRLDEVTGFEIVEALR